MDYLKSRGFKTSCKGTRTRAIAYKKSNQGVGEKVIVPTCSTHGMAPHCPILVFPNPAG